MKHRIVMQNYILQINEIFYSLQGEGNRSGSANIFIRLAKCNKKCSFCDTEFNTYKEYTLKELTDYIKQYHCENIIWTGGEPCLQLTNDIVTYFHKLGYYQAIETNGSLQIPDGLNWITISPKQRKLHGSIKQCNELKFVYPYFTNKLDISRFNIEYDHLYISPCFDGLKALYTNINECIEFVKKNPNYK